MTPTAALGNIQICLDAINPGALAVNLSIRQAGGSTPAKNFRRDEMTTGELSRLTAY